VEPHVVFGPGVSVAEGAIIHAFSHLEGARVAGGADGVRIVSGGNAGRCMARAIGVNGLAAVSLKVGG
jgi:hypothetical protein